jgi:23S rRNA-/tRNA-specific pseudouridylate synthase
MNSASAKNEPLQILPILVETPNYVIVNKPYDLCINGEKELLKHGQTVASLLSLQRPDLTDNGVCSGFRFPHQLDYATSGALCITLNKKTTREAVKLFKERKVDKEYLALVRLCSSFLKSLQYRNLTDFQEMFKKYFFQGAWSCDRRHPDCEVYDWRGSS